MTALLFALALAGLVAATPAQAEQPSIVSRAVPDPARWDLAGAVGWIGVDKAGVAPRWDEWYDAAAFGGSGGYYWTPHVKLEAGVWTTTPGRVVVHEPLPTPGQAALAYRIGERRIRSDHLAGGLLYQFFENTWFHPFAGAGVEGIRESDQLGAHAFCSSATCVPVRWTIETSTTYRLRPFVQAGFKWYVSERAFIRSDARGVLSGRGLASARWVAGFGSDF